MKRRHFLLNAGLLGLLLACPLAQGAEPADTRAGLWRESVAAERQGALDEGVRKAAAYLAAGGEEYLAAMRAGWLNYQKKDWPAASTAYRRAAQLRATSLSPRLGLLNVAQGMGDTKATAKAAEGVLQVEPTNYRALTALAAIEWENKDYRKSLSYYQRLETLYPEDPDALSGAGWCLLYCGRKRDAKICFERLLLIKPDQKYAKEGYDYSNAR